MTREDLIKRANINREKVLARYHSGEKKLQDMQPGTISALNRPVTQLMRPLIAERKDSAGNQLVRVYIIGQGFKEVVACKEVLPERKAFI